MLSKYVKEPCKDGDCLVKVTCQLPIKNPWTRQERCPIYAKYIKKRDSIDKYCKKISTIFWGVIFVTFYAFVLVTFARGLWEQYKLIKGWLF